MPLLTLWHQGPSGPGFDPSPFAGGFGEPFDRSQLVSRRNRWFAPEAESFVPQPPAAAPFDPATMDWGDRRQDRSRRSRWFAPEAEGKAPATPPGRVTNLSVIVEDPFRIRFAWTDPAGGSSPLVDIKIYRYVPDMFGAPTLVATVAAGIGTGVDRYGELQNYTATEDNVIWELVATNAEGLTSIIATAASLASLQDGGSGGDSLWFYPLEQPQDWRSTRWFTPDQEWHPTATGDGPAPGFNPSLVDYGYDRQQDRLRPGWTVDRPAAFDGFVPIPDIVFDPASVDWGYDPGQDRSWQPTWRQPDNAEPPVFPTLPVVYVPPTTADLGALTQMDLMARAFGHKRRLQNVIEGGTIAQNPNLYSTFTPATPPYILINAENGDVFVYIGSNFIVPAYDGST